MTKRVYVKVGGRVQGIGFRWFVRETGASMGVSGWVRNLSDGSVELEAQAEPQKLDRFIDAIKTRHPHARIDDFQTRDLPPRTSESDFEIHH